MTLKYNEEFKFALRDIVNNSFKLENEFGNTYHVTILITIDFLLVLLYTFYENPNDCRQSSLYRMGS